MPEIRKLDPHVADLIAAGEVVERPASVVKELMENAVDAGATSLTVEIRGGGMALIRVTDNGSGIAPEDVETAFYRHATSKLRDAEGLSAIGTLGFRGEALAAIAAVARVEVTTRRRGDTEGTRLALEGGKVTGRAPCGCPEGTVMTVRDLFFNTPARLKFMKNDRTEGQAVSAAVTRVALSRPEISVRYLREGKEEFHTPGDGRVDSCIYTLLGREAAATLLPAEANDGEIAVTGYVSTPGGCTGNRNRQFFYVNGRHVKSRLLQAALEQAYRNALLPGRFPGCVLYITMKPSAVDVNVHPAKTEVRFVREKQVFDGVYYAALAALADEQGTAELKVSASTRRTITGAAPVTETSAPEAHRAAAKPDAGFYQTMSAERFRSGFASGGFRTAPAAGAAREKRRSAAPEDSQPLHHQTALNLPGEESAPKTFEPSAPAMKRPEAPAPAPDVPEQPAFRVIGEALRTYILVETGDSVLLIDKHAAHERILFDRLRADPRFEGGQILLTPEIVEVGAEDAALVEAQGALLAEYGFDVAPFGETSVAVREIPSYLDGSDVRDVVYDLCTVLRKGGSPAAMREDLLHTMACKAAVKAGSSSQPEQLAELAARVVSGEVKYCPHGRPVAMELTRAALDKGFRRT